MAAVLLMTSTCRNQTDEALLPTDDILTYYPSFEGDSSQTKTHLDGIGSMKWNDLDEVSIFSLNTGNKKYTYQDATQSLHYTNGASTYTSLSGSYAIYPFIATNSISAAGVITTTFPALQEYAAGSFGGGANIMCAVSSDNFLSFKNIGGFIKLQLTGSATVTSIKLRGNDSEKLAGKMQVTPHASSPTVVMDAAASGEITLDCGSGVTLSSTPTPFFIAIPPVTFSQGITIDIYDSDGNCMSKSSSASITVARNHILPMASTPYVPGAGTSYPFMSTSVPGAYASDGTLLYGNTDGYDQTMICTRASDFAYRLLNTVSNKLISVDKIPNTIQVGNTFTVRIDKYNVSSIIPEGDVEVTVVKHSGDTYWLVNTSSPNQGFIINK